MSDEPGRVVRFPQSRVSGSSKNRRARDLGLTPLSRQIESSGRSAKGHWCSRCQGIWWSYFLEAECPVCGNRHG